ncbi:MAG: DUF2118 domain-containing protein [Paenibacillaceae bacterium]
MAFRFDLVAPFAGRIERIYVEVGRRVEEGESLVSLFTDEGVVHHLFSTVTGYIATIEVSQGEFVISGMILACIVVESGAERF